MAIERDGARAGVSFPAYPAVGDVYRQEFLLGEAEDVAEVVSTNYSFGNDPELDLHVPADLANLLCNDDCVVVMEYSALDPGHWQAGIEYVRPHAFAGLDFIAAADVKAAQELDWSRSRSYQAGFEFRRNTPRRLRLMLEYFRGHSPNGQFYREKLSYVGVGVYFRF